MLNLQGNLNLSAGDFIAKSRVTKKGYHAHKLFLAHSDNGNWSESGLSLDNAIFRANFYETENYQDCYVSANGFTFKGGRSQGNVSELTSLWVDFDYYKTPYANLSVPDFATTVLNENPWLPVPSCLIDSGKGCWFRWDFKRPLFLTSKEYDWLSGWQTSQDFLTNELKPYGADTASSESARVMRLPNTINSKTSRRAMSWETSAKYEYNDLKSAINSRYREVKKDSIILVPKTTPKRAFRGNQEASKAFTWHSLAKARIDDMQRLACLRGGRFDDHRSMGAFIFAVESAHFCRDKNTLISEVETFAHNYFVNPEQSLKRQNFDEVARRMVGYVDRGSVLADRKDNPYTIGHEYIINQLEITEAEQSKMRVIIGPKEKYKRKVDKRRQAGMKPRAEYLEDANNRKNKAIELKVQGFKTSEIAKELGVNKSSVFRYLKESQVCP